MVAAGHPLAAIEAPTAEQLRAHLQLVLSDRSSLTGERATGVLDGRRWVFADSAVRGAALLRGVGWCHMPLHTVEDALAAGHLVRLATPTGPRWHAHLLVHRVGEPPGPITTTLLEGLRLTCT